MLKVVEKEPESEEESEEEESGGNKCLTAHATVCVIVWPARTLLLRARIYHNEEWDACLYLTSSLRMNRS